MKNLFKFFLFTILSLQLISCVPTINSRKQEGLLQLNNVEVVDHQLKLKGEGLDKVEKIIVTDQSGADSEFLIGSQNSDEIIAQAISNTLLPLNSILSLSLETAEGAALFNVNVDLPDLGATNGQILQYNSFSGKWQPANAPTSSVISVNGKVGTVALSMDDLADISTAGAISGSILKFDGLNWVIGTDNGGSSSNATSIHNRTISSALPTDGQVMVWNNSLSQWEPQTISAGGGGGSGEVNTASNIGGTSLVYQKNGVDLEFFGLGSSNGDLSISQNLVGTKYVDLTVNTSNGANDLLRLDGSGALPAVDGSNLTGVLLTDDTIQGRSVASTAPTNGQALLWNNISSLWEPTTIAAGGAGGEVNTASSAGGVALYQNKVGANLVFKGLSNTSDISLTSNANDVEIGVNTGNGANELLRLDASGRLPALDGSLLTGISGGSGETNTATSLGGEAVFKQKTGSDLEFKGLAVSSDLTLTSSPNTVDIQVNTSNAANQLLRLDSSGRLPALDGSLLTGVVGGSGQTNTASSVGGESIFKQKTGADLEFKGIAASSDFSITGSANTVDFQISTTNSANELLRLDGSGRLPAIDGSQLVNLPSATADATKLQGLDILSGTPSDNDVLTYDTTNSRWEFAPAPGAGGGESNSGSNAGSGAGVFRSKVGSNIVLRSILSTGDISVTENTDDITIDVNATNTANGLIRVDGLGRLPALDGSLLTNIAGVGETNTASSLGGTPIFNAKNGLDLEFKGLTASSDISLTANANDIQIGIISSNGSNQLLRLDGTGKLPAIDGSNLTGIITSDTTIQGRNVSATAPSDGESLVWNNTLSVWEPQVISGAGESNTVSSAGGTSLFKVKTGSDLQFKGLTGSSDISVTSNTNDLGLTIAGTNAANGLVRLNGSTQLPALDGSLLTGISGAGETNTASNVGVGAGIFKQKVLEDIEFRTLDSSGTDLDFVENVDEIDITIVTANGPNELLRLDGGGELPAISAANLLNVDADTLQGRAIDASISPNDGEVLTWSTSNNRWESVTLPSVTDDLGNHTATQNLQLSDNYLSNGAATGGILMDNGGYVGIGNSTVFPGGSTDLLAQLHVKGDNPKFMIQDSRTISSEAQINLKADDGEAGMSLTNDNYDWSGEGLPDSSWVDTLIFFTSPETSGGMKFVTEDGGIRFFAGSATPSIAVDQTNSNVGIGTASPNSSFMLDVNGAVRGTGAFDTSSDRRFKTDISPISEEVSILERFTKIDGVYYNWNLDKFPNKNFKKDRDMGVIAQDIRKVFPEVVSEDSEGYLSVAYAKLVAPLIEAVKELFSNQKENQRAIASLEERTKKLEEENRQMKEVLCELKPDKPFCKK